MGSATPSMVCHPKWDDGDMRNYPPLPPLLACVIAFAVLTAVLMLLRICIGCAESRLLRKLHRGPKEKLAERLRLEMVAANLILGNKDDPLPLLL